LIEMQLTVAVGFREVPRKKALTVEASEAERGELAVANRNAAARNQKAVDGSHQAAEQGTGGQEADGCSLGHECPFSEVAEEFRFRGTTIVYVYQIPPATTLFAWQQSDGCNAAMS
jgi:hypothetical protein